MKIAQVVSTFPPYRGGMGNSVFYFAKQAAAAGHSLAVFTPRYSKFAVNDAGNLTDAVNFKIFRLKPFLYFGNSAMLPQLIWKLRNFDLVHLHYPFYGAMLPVLIAKLLLNRKMKLLLHYHMDSIGTGLKGLIFKFNKIFVLPLLIKNADFVSCASIDYAKNSALTSLYDKYHQKFITLPFGVDLKIFKPLRLKRDYPGKIILFVASLDKAHYFKGLDVLLSALKILIAEVDKLKDSSALKLVVVGEGELKNYYQELARNLGVSESVEFSGGLSTQDLVLKYNQAEVFVLPSINQGEAFGLVLLEAMACGTPVIASNLPGVRSVFHNGTEGFAVTPGDEKDLAKKIKQILSDDQLRKNMSLAALKLTAEKYDWDKIGIDLVRFYFRANYTPKK